MLFLYLINRSEVFVRKKRWIGMKIELAPLAGNRRRASCY